MPRRPDDDRMVAPAPGTRPPPARTMVVAGGFLLAVPATLVVLLTDDPQYLRVAVVAAAWAFVLAMVALGRHTGDAAEAEAREKAMRRTYALELEREVAARREYELSLDGDLRRQAQEAVRDQLDALRSDIATLGGVREDVARVVALGPDIAAVAGLREQVARVAAMREDVAALGALREDMAALGALRDEVAELASLRTELSQLAELRVDMGRLRAELTEQLSGEMLVERIVMRTQASRLPAETDRVETGTNRAVPVAPTWADEAPPRELTGGWPAIRLDEPIRTRQFDQAAVDRTPPCPPVRPPVPAAPPPVGTAPVGTAPVGTAPVSTASFAGASSSSPPTTSAPITDAPIIDGRPTPPPSWSSRSDAARRRPSPSAADRWSPSAVPDLAPRRSRHSASAAGEPAASPPQPASPQPASPQTAAFAMSASAGPSGSPPSPLEWLAARSVLDPPVSSNRPEVPPRRRRSDGPAAAPMLDEYAPTTQRPAVPGRPSPVPHGTSSAVPRPTSGSGEAGPAAADPDLARILAEHGAAGAPGPRRRRRYREDGESDDVLARVLRGD